MKKTFLLFSLFAISLFAYPNKTKSNNSISKLNNSNSDTLIFSNASYIKDTIIYSWINTPVIFNAQNFHSKRTNDIIESQWNIIKYPNESKSELLIESSQAQIKPDIEGEYQIGKTIITEDYDTIFYLINLIAKSTNQPPTIIAKPGFDAKLGIDYQLDASSSYDLDNDSLIYSWNLETKPKDAIIELNFSSNARGSFKILQGEGEYIFTVKASDGFEDSNIDTIKIQGVSMNDFSNYKKEEFFKLFPNVTDDIINIKYSLTEDANIKVEISDVLGNNKTILLKGFQKSGDYNITYKLKSYKRKQGLQLIYFYINDIFVESKTIILE